MLIALFPGDDLIHQKSGREKKKIFFFMQGTEKRLYVWQFIILAYLIILDIYVNFELQTHSW